MKKALKIALTVAALAVLVGLLLAIIALASVGFDLSRLNGSDIVSENYSFPITDLDSITVESDITDVKIIRSDATSDSIGVTVRQDKRIPHSVDLSEGTLRIRTGERPWYYSLGIFFGEKVVEITVPEGFELERIDLETDTGDVSIDSLSARNVKISSDTGDLILRSSNIASLAVELDTGDVEIYNMTSSLLSVETDTGDVDVKSTTVTDRLGITSDTGDIDLESCSSRELYIESETGDVEMNNTTVTDKITINTDTGDVNLENCDSYELYIESDTGDVELTLLTPKSFDADSSTGRVRVPAASTGGTCRIRTATGDIEARVK